MRAWVRMSKNTKNKLVPKLRFPEFQKTVEWSICEFKDLIEIIEERAGTKKYTLMSVTAGEGLVSQIEKFGREIAGNAYMNYYVIQKGDFAYNKSSTKQYPEGYIAMLTDNDKAALPNSIFTCFRITDENTCSKIFDHLFHANYHGSWLRKFIAVGARAHGSLNIDTKHLLDMPVVLPLFREQKKIADCLTSLDDLISAEVDKLEAYKTHKKGLMQKLFPAEGKTVPEWRFSEFRGEGEWQIKPLGEIGENFDSKREPITAKNRSHGDVPYYGASGIVDYVKGHIFNERLLCISEDGANLLARTYPIAFTISGKSWVNNHAHVLRFGEIFTQVLIENYLNSISLADFLTGMAQPKLNRAKLDIIPIPLPDPPEQQKIADCLASLDELITAQTQKIKTLKNHKKGLMQGLFPSAGEVGE